MGDTEPEHIQKSFEKQRVTSAIGAEFGAILPPGAARLPSELEIIARWSQLPVTLQKAILTIARASLDADQAKPG